MCEYSKDSNEKVYRCWISEEDRIVSFSPVEGYEAKEFKSYSDFQEYCYRKTYWGYRVQ